MNALQYIVVILIGSAFIYTPFILANAIRRKQKSRVFDIIASDLMLVVLSLDTAFPTVLESAPHPVHWLCMLVLLFWIAIFFFGLLRRLFTSQEA